MLTSSIPTRAVLSVVPELRQVILRALHSSRHASATTSHSTSYASNRPPPPHVGRTPSFTSGEDIEVSVKRAARPRTGARDPPPSLGFGLRSPSTASSSGRIAPSSSKRLADLSGRDNLRTPSKHAAFPSIAPAGKGRSKLDFLKSLPRPDASLTHSEVVSAKPHPFSDYPLNPALLESLPNLLSTPEVGAFMTTPIQSISLTRLLEAPSNALLAAETGSGKTLAYMLPLLHHLKITDTHSASQAVESKPLPGVLGNLFSSPPSPRSDKLLPRSLIIPPTHELTRQSTGVAKALGHGIKLSVLGTSSTKENAASDGRKGVVDVLVGTSGSMRRMLGIKKDGDGEQHRETARDRRLKKNEEEEDEDEEGDRSRRVARGPRVSLERTEWVVIDEADVLLGPSFIDETTQILSLLPSHTRIILCTATLPPSLLTAISTHPHLRSRDIPQLLAPGLHRLPPGLKTRFVNDTGGHLAATVVKEVKQAFMDDALEDRSLARGSSGAGRVREAAAKSRAVVFCNTDMRAREVARKFREKEGDLGVLEWTSGGEGRTRGSQGQLAPFLQSQPGRPSNSARTPPLPGTAKPPPAPRVLITTSLLSRGLDFNEEVRTVVLVDPPKDTLDFVHRAGRTGRAGRAGRVIVFGMGDGVGGSRGVQGRGGVGRGVAGVLKAGGRRG